MGFRISRIGWLPCPAEVRILYKLRARCDVRRRQRLQAIQAAAAEGPSVEQSVSRARCPEFGEQRAEPYTVRGES